MRIACRALENAYEALRRRLAARREARETARTHAAWRAEAQSPEAARIAKAMAARAR